MGCDIHLYTERKQGDIWVTCDKWTPPKVEDEETCAHVDFDHRLYTGRNYNLFAILADVRNGRGFAGIKTGEGFNPIAEPRGVPEDACAEYKDEAESWGSDGHSHSYLTVSEIMGFDWTQVSRLQGYVDIVAFEKFERWQRRNGESPSDYCGGISGSSIRHVTNEEMSALVKSVPDNLHGDVFTRALKDVGLGAYTLLEWKQPYYKCCSGFLSEALPKLWRLGKPEDVRIVFFFDN